jgi:protein-tyrosine phosphatase
MKVLMVCLGNICRSPLAEGILQERAWRAGLDWSVESAGTLGYHAGSPPHPMSIKVAFSNGIDIGTQRARHFVAEDFDRYDRIFALAGDVMREIERIAGKRFDASKADLLMNVSRPGEDMDVPDPYGGPESDYREAFQLIDEACTRFVEMHVTKKQR